MVVAVKLFQILCLLFFVSIPSWCLAYTKVGTVYTTDGSRTDVQAAVTNASDGDTVNLPAGTFDWASTYVTISNKNVSIVGAGIDSTILQIGNRAFSVSIVTKASWRISGMTLQTKTGSQVLIQIDGGMDSGATTYTYGWRIDHIKFDISGDSAAPIQIYGSTWGVIDNSTFIGTATGLPIAVNVDAQMAVDGTYGGVKISGSYDIGQPLDLGGSSAVYVEDCTFTPGASSAWAYFDIDQGAGRIVLRYNTLGDGYFYTHETRNTHIGATKVEIYGNTFTGGSTYAQGGGYPGRLNSGTGVIYNNTFSSPYDSKIFIMYELRGTTNDGPLALCDGSHVWDGNVEASGWPCLGQIGRGSGTPGSQESVPLYAWNNGVESTCATGGTCTNTYSIATSTSTYVKSTAHSNGEVDYVNAVNTAKAGYTAYTYPHPLRGVPPTSATGCTLVGTTLK
jgi:hypothetical protein